MGIRLTLFIHRYPEFSAVRQMVSLPSLVRLRALATILGCRAHLPNGERT